MINPASDGPDVLPHQRVCFLGFVPGYGIEDSFVEHKRLGNISLRFDLTCLKTDLVKGVFGMFLDVDQKVIA